MAKYDPVTILGQWAIEFHECGDFPDQVSIIFDGYAENEDGSEDKSSFCYAIFVHKNSGSKGFKFPEHITHGNLITHSTDEACFYVWLNDVDGEVTVENISDGDDSTDDLDKFHKIIVKIEKEFQEG